MGNKRVIGLDVLRILSMFFIIGLHLINNGGILANTPVLSVKYFVLVIMLVFFYTSVNIFAMLTGYLSCNKKKIKSVRLIELISIVIFYCVLIFISFYIFDKSIFGDLSVKSFLTNLFPFLFGRYWYIVSYCVVFILIPYLNVFTEKIDNNSYKKFLISLFLMFSVVQIFFPHIDLFKINKGYSPFWLIIMYFIGSYIKRNENDLKIKLNANKSALLVFVACLINIFYRITSYIIFKKVIFDDVFLNYISPVNIILSVTIFVNFLKLNIKSSVVKYCIEQLSLSAFSVYIIHSNIIIFDHYISKFNLITNNLNFILLFIVIIVSIIGIYAICFIVDIFRRFFFKLLKINSLMNRVGCLIDEKI